MKRLSSGVLAAVTAAIIGLTTLSATTVTKAAQGNTGPYATASKSSPAKIVAQVTSAPSADFGSPPSGEVPILFNDRHVYARPDRLNQNRVLAALVRGNTILVPLRSMFEQMGATVSYDAASKTVSVVKPGSDVKVTVGKPEVIVNGESRPLDVPPEIYKGTVVVPLRVLSEGMGAYVQWVAEKRTVVVRYIAAPVPTPPPATATPAPVIVPATAPPPPPPTAAPTLPPVKSNYEHFIVGDYIFSPKVYNELSPGNSGKNSTRIAAAFEFPLFGIPWMLEGDVRNFRYPHNQTGPTPGNPILPGPVCQPGSGEQGCVTTIGGNGQVFVPAFQARDTDFDGRFGLKIADPRVYIGIGYLYRYTNYGYPIQRGLGFGIEKLPDVDQPFSIYGHVFYYPQVSGNFTDPNGNQFKIQYRVLKYGIGGTFNFGSSPLFLDFGFLGDRGNNKQNAPSDFTHTGPYVGLGIHF